MASTINPTKSKNNDAGAQSLSTTTTDAVPSTSTTKSVAPSNAQIAKVKINRRRQEGNPIIKHVRNVPYEFVNELRPDFECTPKTGVLFLSLRYHKLHPGYIETRLADLSLYALKVVLLLQDVEEPSFLLRDLNMLCYRLGLSLVLCYSHEETAEYIEHFRLCERKTPESVIASIKQYNKKNRWNRNRNDGGEFAAEKGKIEQLFESAVELLSSIRSITKSDAKSLLTTFGSIRGIASANEEHLVTCTGLGPRKAAEIVKFFHETKFLIDR